MSPVVLVLPGPLPDVGAVAGFLLHVCAKLK